MKYLAVSAVLFLVVLAAANEERHCRRQSECEDDECCLNKWIFKNVCTKRGDEGDSCRRIGIDGVIAKDIYIGNCPCKAGLDCRELTKEEGGSWTKLFDVKCRPITTVKPTESEAPTEKTKAPIEETEAPIEETEAPTEETIAPIEETEAPIEETEAPIE